MTLEICKKVSLVKIALVLIVNFFFLHKILYANESLNKLDVLVFAYSGECGAYPYKIVKDLNGKNILIHIEKSKPININVSALISDNFTVFQSETNAADFKNINRSKLLSELVGREADDEYKEIIRAKLKLIGVDNINFLGSNSSLMWHCDSMNGYHVTSVLRMDLDLQIGNAIKYGLKSGEIILIGEIPAAEIFIPVSEKIQKEFIDVRRTLDLLHKDSSSIAAIVKYKQGQNYMSLKSSGPCVIRAKDVSENDSKLGFRVSSQIKNRFKYNNEQNFSLVVDSVDSLWLNIQSGKCDISFTTGDEFGVLKKALESSKDDEFRVELGQTKYESILSLVQNKGYKDMDAYRFANTFNPILSPYSVSRFASYDILNSDSLSSTIARMKLTKYEKDDVTPSVELIFQFLSDEENGKKVGLSVLAFRNKRVKDEEVRLQQEKARLAKIEAQRARITFRLGVVCMGTDLAGTLMKNIVSMYASNTNNLAIANYVTAVPGCLFPKQSSAFQGGAIIEFFRSGRFVGVRTLQQINGQYIYGIVTASDWDMTDSR